MPPRTRKIAIDRIALDDPDAERGPIEMMPLVEAVADTLGAPARCKRQARRRRRWMSGRRKVTPHPRNEIADGAASLSVPAVLLFTNVGVSGV